MESFFLGLGMGGCSSVWVEPGSGPGAARQIGGIGVRFPRLVFTSLRSDPFSLSFLSHLRPGVACCDAVGAYRCMVSVQIAGCGGTDLFDVSGPSPVCQLLCFLGCYQGGGQCPRSTYRFLRGRIVCKSADGHVWRFGIDWE